jgi:dolichyl-phosphate beta-glucosyltransferase
VLFLSVVIPSFKGSAVLSNNVPGLIAYFREKKIEHEIIIVDDGSADHGATEKVAATLGCRFLKNDQNEGKGSAVRKGMLAANGRYRIFTDVDIPFEHEAFDRFLHYLDVKEFDVVIGDRTLPGSSYFAEIPGIRKFGSDIFSFIVGRFVAGGHFDTQCGMKGFRDDVALDLFSKGRVRGFAFDVELLYISLKRNYNIKRLPVVLRCQEGSSVNVIVHGMGMLFDLLRIKANHVRGLYNREDHGRHT